MINKLERHQMVGRLLNAQFVAPQAEAITEEICNTAIAQGINSNKCLDAKFSQLTAQLDTKIGRMHNDLLKWFIRISLAQVAGILIPCMLAFFGLAWK